MLSLFFAPCCMNEILVGALELLTQSSKRVWKKMGGGAQAGGKMIQGVENRSLKENLVRLVCSG